MTEAQSPREKTFLVVAGSLATIAYWLVVATLAVAQFWAICVPGTQGCPTVVVMAARAVGVLGLGLAGFAFGVWSMRRFPTLAPYLAAAVIAALLVVGASIATLVGH